MPNLWTRGKVASANKSVGDPNQTHRFTVEIDGVTLGGIHRVDGIVHENEVITTHDGDMQHQQLAPGRIVQGTITIERDFVATREFVDWRRTVIDGKTVRKSLSVVALAPDEIGRPTSEPPSPLNFLMRLLLGKKKITQSLSRL